MIGACIPPWLQSPSLLAHAQSNVALRGVVPSKGVVQWSAVRSFMGDIIGHTLAQVSDVFIFIWRWSQCTFQSLRTSVPSRYLCYNPPSQAGGALYSPRKARQFRPFRNVVFFEASTQGLNIIPQQNTLVTVRLWIYIYVRSETSDSQPDCEIGDMVTLELPPMFEVDTQVYNMPLGRWGCMPALMST